MELEGALQTHGTENSKQVFPHECGNWERGSAVSFLGTHKSDLVCSVRMKKDPKGGK